MQLIDFLSNYAPYDDVEEGAVRSFRQFLSTYGDRACDRDNLVGHLSASAWIVNRERNRVLMVYHNLYDTWAWVGGHADGDKDLLRVALKETSEETGLKKVGVIGNGPVDVNVWWFTIILNAALWCRLICIITLFICWKPMKKACCVLSRMKIQA